MKIISIAAVSKNGCIGVDGKLPWHIPEDLKFFKDSTRGQMVLMGRKTLESLGKPLPNRINAVLTRDPNYKAPEGVRVFSEVKAAIDFFTSSTQDAGIVQERNAGKNLFVIGGAQIYLQAMPFVDEVWLTEIDQEAKGDTFFPEYKNGKFLLAVQDGAGSAGSGALVKGVQFKKIKSLPRTDLTVPANYVFNFYERTPK